MKTNVTVSVDVDGVQEAKKQGLNISSICNEAINDAILIDLTPEQKAAQGIAFANAYIKKEEDKENITLLHKKVVQFQEQLAPLLQDQTNAKTWRESRRLFPYSSSFGNDAKALDSYCRRAVFVLNAINGDKAKVGLIKKVSPKPPSKKKAKKNAPLS